MVFLKYYTQYTGLPESDTNTSPAFAALLTDLITLLVSNLGVIIGVLACLGGSCLGVTIDDEVLPPLLPVPFLVVLFFLLTDGVLFSFAFLLFFRADFILETVESTP